MAISLGIYPIFRQTHFLGGWTCDNCDQIPSSCAAQCIASLPIMTRQYGFRCACWMTILHNTCWWFCKASAQQFSPTIQPNNSNQRNWSNWVCLKMGYTPNYSHLVGIMISKTIGFRGTLFSDKPTWSRPAPSFRRRICGRATSAALLRHSWLLSGARRTTPYGGRWDNSLPHFWWILPSGELT